MKMRRRQAVPRRLPEAWASLLSDLALHDQLVRLWD